MACNSASASKKSSSRAFPSYATPTVAGQFQFAQVENCPSSSASRDNFEIRRQAEEVRRARAFEFQEIGLAVELLDDRTLRRVMSGNGNQ